MKHTLEGLRYTDRAIASYEGMNDGIRELIKRTDYTGNAQARMEAYTSRRIEEVQAHHNYWLKLIHELDDDRYRNVLKLRYIEGLTVEETAEDLFYSVRHINKLTNDAVEELAKLHEKHAHSKRYKVEFNQ